MSGRKKTTTIVLIGAIALVLAAVAFFSYRYFFFISVNPVSCIPYDANAVIEIKKPYEFLSKLENGNKIWQEISSLKTIQGFKKELLRLDSISRQSGVDRMLDENPIYIVFNGVGEESYDPVILLQFREQTSREKWESFLTLAYPHERQSGRFSLTGPHVHSFRTNQGDSCFYVIKSGVFILGCDLKHVSNVMGQIGKSGSLKDDPEFMRLQETAGKNVDANLYFKFKFIRNLLDILQVNNKEGFLTELEHFGSWSATDLLIKDDEILLTGYTLAKDEATFLNSFNGQSSVELQVFNVLPFNTQSIFWLGSNNMGEYDKKYSNFIDKLNDSLKTDRDGLMGFPFQGISSSEAAIVRTWPTSGQPAATFQIIKDDPQSKIGSYLKSAEISTIIDRHKETVIYKIKQLSEKAEGGTGNVVKLSNQYFTRNGQYFITSASFKEILSYINTINNGKTLDISENFKSFSDNIAEDANVFYYYNLRNGIQLLTEHVTAGLKSDLSENSNSLKNLQGLSFQFSKLNGFFFTNIYLRHNQNYKEEDLSVWKAVLDDKISRQPFLVLDHRTDNLKIVAFDESNNIYLIDHNGNIIWKILLAEQPVSGVYQVDFYKNGKIQYLFNTENYIYLIDLLGRYVDNYPIRLNKPATSGMALFDYDGKKEYRLLIPTDDKIIYNYDIQGERVKGWKDPKMSDIVLDPPYHLVVSKKDHIIASDRDGKIRILDRQGNTRIKLRDSFIKAANSDFYLNKTNSKGSIITTDENGHLIYIKSNGKISRTVFNDFTKDHYFLYEDFNRNGKKDFIYIDNDKLTIFNRFKEVIFDYSFDEKITTSPQIFTNSQGARIVGIVLKDSGRLVLFNGTDDIMISSGLLGETPFTIGSLQQDDDLNLIVGAEQMIYNYIIE